MSFSVRQRWMFGWIAIAVLVGLTLFAAPQSRPLASGSTYNRAPDGYGAWYAYMDNQGSPAKRWQKDQSELPESDAKTPQTFVQISPSTLIYALTEAQKDWIKQGNTWIILGEEGFPTEASFSTEVAGEQDTLKIETTRRKQLDDAQTAILRDRFGAVLWEEPLGDGRIIRSVTPFIGANAYQDNPGNFSFLRRLVLQQGPSIWVDESIHGYLDAESQDVETTGNWITYLSQTPLLVILIQFGVVLAVLIWAKNRRFGPSLPLSHPQLDNSEAYIQALAGVLEKAGRSEFVLELVGHEEQLQLQRSLGLGSRRLDRETLISAWVAQTGCSASELEEFLRNAQASSLKHRELLAWIQQIKVIRDQSFSSG